MNEKIIVVVVTYNRKKLLLETVKALLGQTKDFHKIIIVDNASTDGTKITLEELGYLSNKKIRYHKSEINTGGSGGFNIGMNIALSDGADWIWVMDDDVAPKNDCLEELFKWCTFSECIHPKRINPDGTDFEWEHYVDIYTCSKTPLKNVSFKNGKEITYTNAACFEGMLVSKRIVNLCGLPDTKYFIGEDDTLYGIKTSAHTNNAYVEKSIMYRLLPPPKSLQPWKNYYLMRNKFYLFRDSIEFLNINISKSIRFKFIMLRIIDLFISTKYGRKCFMETLRGLNDGLKYFNKINLNQNDA